MVLLSEKRNRKWCPFVMDPFDDCLCINMDSQNIEATLHYCGGNYGQCEIYAGRDGRKEKKNTRLLENRPTNPS